ncbi:hypothetical protein Y032_0167g120 [Ancylostoma ceylanicum]|uniref:Uncharacterized protein n=1 Tax=Ancylostoma ceylanicum TaxID=53326 RepID=A0A016SWQ5_9BILA|nr:hypothetical protein Y032_0167g120 [Ancylostoma ceylanicum]
MDHRQTLSRWRGKPGRKIPREDPERANYIPKLRSIDCDRINRINNHAVNEDVIGVARTRHTEERII